MKSWQDITVAALIGTERHSLKIAQPDTSEADALGSTFSGLDTSDPERALLVSAALAAVYRRAGTRPVVLDAHNPGAMPVALDEHADVLPECSAAATSLLVEVFGGVRQELQMEALRLLATAGQRVSPILLPQLLDIGRQKADMRDAIGRVIGNRGVWLASQNPDWSYAAMEVDEDDWEHATRASRVATLTRLGITDPNRARRLIESAWAEDSADDHAAFLATRAVGLSMEDEELLENALDDRSKAVRSVAADLLAHLPQSRLSRRMIERLDPLISHAYRFAGGHALTVTPPETCDASMIRDGLEGHSKSANGEKAGWLRDMVAAVPPSHWSAKFELEAQEIVGLAQKSEWRDAILSGLAKAACRHPNDEWTLALLNAELKRPPGSGNVLDLDDAVAKLSAEKLELVLISLLGRGPLAASGSFRRLLSQHPGPWSATFGTAVLAKIGESLEKFGDNETMNAVAAIMREIVRNMPPAMAPDLEAILRSADQQSRYWQSVADRSCETLRFRSQLHDAILETPVH